MARRPSRRWAEGAIILAIGAAALLVRAWPISRVSLWWDELVHLETASQADLLAVFLAAKLGIPPGTGNAGAVPLDYLLLHAWLRLVPRPAVELLEVHYRLPALLFSVATVVSVYVYARRFFDRGIAILAAVILALSISHALYAAEVRFYALFGLLAVVNLHAFSAVLLGPERISPWVVYTLVNILYFASGLFSLLVILGQYIVIGCLLARDLARQQTRASRLALPLASGLALGGVVGLYFQGTFLDATYGRGDHPSLDYWGALRGTLAFFALDNAPLLWLFVASLGLILWYGWQRDGERLAISAHLVSCFLAIPAIVEVERWKEYYFHPRHALFLLPAFAIVTATGLLTGVRVLNPLRRLVPNAPLRDATYVVAALVAVLALQVGPLRRHLANPDHHFSRTKVLRDFRALALHLRERLAELPPEQRYLIVAERNEPGHLGNPVFAKYLEWYGIADRVVLRGTSRPDEMRGRLARACARGCVGRQTAELELLLGIGDPLDLKPEIRALVGLDQEKRVQGPVGAVGVVQYWRLRNGPPRSAPGFSAMHVQGVSFFELSPTIDAGPRAPAAAIADEGPSPSSPPGIPPHRGARRQ